jgi:hypothetical protein
MENTIKSQRSLKCLIHRNRIKKPWLYSQG